jgi:hypothetical protein
MEMEVTVILLVSAIVDHMVSISTVETSDFELRLLTVIELISLDLSTGVRAHEIVI